MFIFVCFQIEHVAPLDISTSQKQPSIDTSALQLKITALRAQIDKITTENQKLIQKLENSESETAAKIKVSVRQKLIVFI